MRSTSARSSVALLAVVLAAVLVTGGVAGPVVATTPTADSSSAIDASPATESIAASSAVTEPQADRPADPSTEDTVGYVEGYWYDDELPVDDRSDAVVDESELDAVVYRSMARVERIRNLTFEDGVDVDVVTRSEYQETNDDRFTNVTDADRLEGNVGYEALFMVDRDTDAMNSTKSVYGGSVAGYYDPETDEIVIVSNNPETPELDELTLGHELVHALQDQRFDLESLEGTTQDSDTGISGLVEGDASHVENEYERRCRTDWDCLTPSGSGGQGGVGDVNWGIYFSIYQPYSDGPDYVDHLREQGPGWSAVNAAYDDPPTTTSAVIHPGSDREPATVSVPDRSSEDWRQLRIDGEVANDTVGEAGMVAMFAADTVDRNRESVISADDFFRGGTGEYDYDQPATDGWAGDELVVYTNDDADAASGPGAAGDAGYVWRTQWDTVDDTEQFVDAYGQLLATHGAESVEDRQDTAVIEDGGYAGAYYLERDGRTVTIVRAPSVAELPNVEAGAAPAGENELLTLEEGAETVPGFGVGVAAIALALAAVVARVAAGHGRN
ncbi:Hvo_1808 family surface protein [Natrinema sp. CGMCC1.2065]|uniref:Hvo_1808 family surface protein n=1 Tax=Natrinema sp. CGMCC1.2065 TaxID=3445767 RepID=UPI003F4A4A97